MIELKYKQLLDIVKGKPFPEGPFADFRIKGLSIDSRTIEPQNLFMAIKGEKFDGHDFIKLAIDKGASCVVISENRLKNKEIPYISSTSGKGRFWLKIPELPCKILQNGTGINLMSK